MPRVIETPDGEDGRSYHGEELLEEAQMEWRIPFRFTCACDNLAEYLDETEIILERFRQSFVRLTKTIMESRSEWEETYTKGLRSAWC